MIATEMFVAAIKVKSFCRSDNLIFKKLYGLLIIIIKLDLLHLDALKWNCFRLDSDFYLHLK